MLSIDVQARVGGFALDAKLPPAGGVTILVGANGAGKSTLLETLLGVIRPERGHIALGDRTLFDAEGGVDVPTEERRIGYVPQRYALFTHMTVMQNVAFGIRHLPKAERHERVMALLDDLGIGHLAPRRTTALSGGESQRVALARALAIGPHALLLDEPMAALDASARRRVRHFLAERLQSVAVPTIVVSHDIDDVEALGGRVAVLEQGKIVQVGELEEIRQEPATSFVKAFLCKS